MFAGRRDGTQCTSHTTAPPAFPHVPKSMSKYNNKIWIAWKRLPTTTTSQSKCSPAYYLFGLSLVTSQYRLLCHEVRANGQRPRSRGKRKRERSFTADDQLCHRFIPCPLGVRFFLTHLGASVLPSGKWRIIVSCNWDPMPCSPRSLGFILSICCYHLLSLLLLCSSARPFIFWRFGDWNIPDQEDDLALSCHY